MNPARFRNIRLLISFPAIALANHLGAAAAAADQAATLPHEVSTDSAAAAWTALSSSLPISWSQQKGPGSMEWEKIVADARAFREKFPSDPHAAAAGKWEVLARIRADDASTVLSAATEEAAGSYLADRTNPERDRLEVTIVFAQARLKRREFKNRDLALAAHEAHARNLITDFPEQPEGYGYLLALSKAAVAADARELARELLAGRMPKSLRPQAERVLARLELEGRPFQLRGAEDRLTAARGRVLFVYSWTAADEGVLHFVRELEQLGDFEFLGVNLDTDTSAAREAAERLRPPGPQLYDGGGLDGPLAQQLALTMPASLYLIGTDGVLVDVDAHRNAKATLTRISIKAEGRP